MMKVTISEEWRRFQVRIGDKLIGSIEGRKGYFCAYGLRPDNEKSRPFHGSETTLRRAMQRLLCANGYGKSGPGYRVKLMDVA
jgi:hypothetical protein